MPLNTAQRDLLVDWQDISIGQFDRYADAWTTGEISLADYERLFKQELKDLYIASVWTATGSPEATTQRHYGLAGRRLRDQYGFVSDFFQEVEAGEMTINQIKARGALYARSSRQITEQIGGQQDGLPLLPAYPADGSTICKTNDKCTLRTENVQNGFDVFWVLHPAEHCRDCVRRSANSPLRVRFGRVVNAGAWA